MLTGQVPFRDEMMEVAKERAPQLESYLEYAVNLKPVFDRIETKIFFELGNAVIIH